MGFKQSDHLVFHESWFGEVSSIAERMERVMRNAANCASSLRAAAYRVDAFDVRKEGARRTV